MRAQVRRAQALQVIETDPTLMRERRLFIADIIAELESRGAA